MDADGDRRNQRDQRSGDCGLARGAGISAGGGRSAWRGGQRGRHGEILMKIKLKYETGCNPLYNLLMRQFAGGLDEIV